MIIHNNYPKEKKGAEFHLEKTFARLMAPESVDEAILEQNIGQQITTHHRECGSFSAETPEHEEPFREFEKELDTLTQTVQCCGQLIREISDELNEDNEEMMVDFDSPAEIARLEALVVEASQSLDRFSSIRTVLENNHCDSGQQGAQLSKADITDLAERLHSIQSILTGSTA
jgi:hypothetical protein